MSLTDLSVLVPPSRGQDQRGMCEQALLTVKGVISFTFQMASKRCTVRIRSDLPTEVTAWSSGSHTHTQTYIKTDWCLT